jgi:hypothetical protein
MRPFIWIAVVGVAVPFVVGCEESGPQRYEVNGTVTLDGEPIPTGDILFESPDGSMVDAGQIKDGKFSFEAQPGSKLISIRASRKKFGPPGIGARGENFILVRYIPARYEDPQYRLKAEVEASREETANHFDFKLTTKPES